MIRREGWATLAKEPSRRAHARNTCMLGRRCAFAATRGDECSECSRTAIVTRPYGSIYPIRDSVA
jgi:hypothetical protein